MATDRNIGDAQHDEAAKRRALDDLDAVEASALPAGAALALARIASEWEE